MTNYIGRMPENEEAVILDELERMRLMAKAVANSAHPFLIGFKDGRILLVNHAFCQLTGFTEEELLNMTWNHDLTPSEWHEVQENTIEEVYRTKKALHYEKEYLRKDGTRIPVEVFIHPYLNDIGQITYYYGFVTDLTSRNQAVEELRKSETHLRELTENMRDIYMKVDNRGFIEYTNPAFKTVLGYEPRDTLGTFFIDVIHPDDEVRVRKEFTEYMKNRQPARIDYRCRHADGHYLYVETVGSWLIDNDEITSIILITRDITNRKLAETALRQSEEKFSKIFKFSPDTIAISILEDGRYVDVNDAFTQLTGYERYEAIGHTAFELGIWVDTADRDYFTNLLKNHGSVSGLELRFRVKSGEIITALVSGEIIEMDGRHHLLVVVKDITDRKRLDEILRLSEERFSKAFNASPLLMAIISLNDGRIIDVNQSLCRITGYSREELIGHKSLDLGLWKEPNEPTLIKQIIEHQESFHDVELSFITKSGQLLLGLCSAESIDIGDESCLLFIIMDITERKKMAMEITRLDRMNLVGQMAASIGHEIRNPMTTVRGFLQVLNDKEKYAEDSEILNLMIEEIDRANAIIKEFLSLAKDKLIEPKMQNINSVISNMLPLFQADAMSQEKYISIKLGNVPDLLLDEKEIRQLLLNLVRNGLEAMSSGGMLTIMTFMEDENVVLSVQDQGHGMSKDVIEKLGTPFFTTKDDGTGLGMAVCYGIAKRHGAAIAIDTGPSGTIFSIKFALNDRGKTGSIKN